MVKTPTPTPLYPPLEYRLQGMRTEAQVYKRLSAPPRTPIFIDWDFSVCCLTIEYLANGPLGEFITSRAKDPRANAISLSLWWRWAKQAAEGMRLLHSHGVIHGDISPRNFLLDGELNFMIADFTGSSLFGLALGGTVRARIRFRGVYLPPRNQIPPSKLRRRETSAAV